RCCGSPPTLYTCSWVGACPEALSFFFFSSRRRHTRCYRDWSSDVCSSDLFRSCPADRIATALAILSAGQLLNTAAGPLGQVINQIGRASCRERVEDAVGAGVVRERQEASSQGQGGEEGDGAMKRGLVGEST